MLRLPEAVVDENDGGRLGSPRHLCENARGKQRKDRPVDAGAMPGTCHPETLAVQAGVARIILRSPIMTPEYRPADGTGIAGEGRRWRQDARVPGRFRHYSPRGPRAGTGTGSRRTPDRIRRVARSRPGLDAAPAVPAPGTEAPVRGGSVGARPVNRETGRRIPVPGCRAPGTGPVWRSP